MIYTITKIESVTLKTGRVKKSATLEAKEGGSVIKNVTIWSSFPNFTNLEVGMQVDATIETTQNGQFTNHTLQPAMNPNGTYRPTPGGNFKATRPDIKVAQERKAEMIGHAQDNKELGIKISSTMRMAVDCAMGQIRNSELMFGADEIKKIITHYRAWFWQEWDNYPKSPTDLNEPPSFE